MVQERCVCRRGSCGVVRALVLADHAGARRRCRSTRPARSRRSPPTSRMAHPAEHRRTLATVEYGCRGDACQQHACSSTSIARAAEGHRCRGQKLASRRVRTRSSTSAIGKRRRTRSLEFQASYNPILRHRRQAAQGGEVRHGITAQVNASAENKEAARRASTRRRPSHRVRSRRPHPHGEREFPQHARLPPGRSARPASRHVRGSGRIAPAPNTGCSGRSSHAASTTRTSTSASARAARKSGSRRATTRSSTPTASPTRW